MIVFIIGASLSAKIFEIILNLKLAKAIGLYWPTDRTLGTLGMRTIVLALKLGSSQSFVKN